MSDVKKIATRESYGNALAELGNEHKDIVVLDADLRQQQRRAYLRRLFQSVTLTVELQRAI